MNETVQKTLYGCVRSSLPLKVGAKQAPLAPDVPLHAHFPANSVTAAPRSLTKSAGKWPMFGNRTKANWFFDSLERGYYTIFL